MIQRRHATLEDDDFLYQLHKAAMQAYISVTWGWDEIWQQNYFREHFDPTRRDILQVDGVDIGVVSIERREDAYYLALIEILPAYQGQGIGTAVIRDFIQQAIEANLPATLHVLKTNEPARRLYERLGFEITAVETHKYKMTFINDG
jgi:ribosomal protein S18 acetylase RimI-like enzyme